MDLSKLFHLKQLHAGGTRLMRFKQKSGVPENKTTEVKHAKTLCRTEGNFSG